jgi:hypothetical protein
MIRGRQGGKTHEAAEWVKAHPDAVMITFSQQEAARLVKQYGLDENRVVSFRSATQLGALRGRRVRIGIDNLDIILRELFGHEVEFVTATGEQA